MKLLYISSLCSDNKFKEIFEMSKKKPSQQAQKFHKLTIKGLYNYIESIYILTSLPINRVNTKKYWFSTFKEIEKDISYHYLPFINLTIIRHIFILISGFITTIFWIIKNKNNEKIIICDVLQLCNSVSALLAAKFMGIKSVAIVTDIPNFMQSSLEKKGYKFIIIKLYRLIYNIIIKKYDSYVILTEHMNVLVNPQNKPYVVIEGMVELQMINRSNRLEDKYTDKVIIYAGALNKKNGILKLIKAFMNLQMSDVRLWLYGSGELEEYIRECEKHEQRIKYFGVVPNDMVIEEELKAILLVNPRPSNREFAKYSFPSKNMEYMVSGTPILTALLPGIPKDYYDFIYLIEDETVAGLTKTLKYILSKNKHELHEKGKLAKEFVIYKKNNLIQTKKIVRMVKEILNHSCQSGDRLK